MSLTKKWNIFRGLDSLTLVTKAGIEVVNQDISQMAGYIAWSIPFLAAGLAKGMGSVTGLATSMLTVPQSAANSAAGEVATGNISLGNSTLGNASYNNMNANKWSDSAIFDGGRMQTVNSMGGMSTYSSGGNEVHDMSATVSRLPNMQVTKNQTEAVHLTQAASQAMNMGTNLSTQAGYSKAKGYEQIGQFMDSHNINEGHGVNFSKDASTEEREALHRAQQGLREFAKAHNVDTSTAFGMAIGLNANAGVSTGKKGGASAGFGLTGGLSGNADSRASNSNSDSEKVNFSQNLSKDLTTVANAVKNNRIELSDSHGNSLNKGINQNFSEADRFEEQSRVYYDAAKGFSKQAQHVSSNTTSTQRETTPDIINHAADIRETITGRPMGKLKAAEILSNPNKYPEQYNLIMSHYEHSQSGTQQLSNITAFNQYAANLGVSNLENKYEQKANNMRNTSNEKIKHDDSIVQSKFENATKGKTIKHEGLQEDVNNKLKDNSTRIQNTEIDKAGVRNEVQDKLKDDAFISRAKKLGNTVLGNSEKLKSNFDDND